VWLGSIRTLIRTGHKHKGAIVADSSRPLLRSAVAMALAGAVALSPVVAYPAALTAPAIPAVHFDDVQLAGIGQDIYAAITPVVQEVVGGGSYIINFTPLVGGLIAAQININYFQGIQPVIEATVNALAGVVQNPFNVLTTLSIYGSALYDIGYNWVSAQLQFLGLAPLPLLPSVASVRGSGARARAAAVEAPPTTGELPGPTPVVPVIVCCTPQVEPPVAAEGPRQVGTARRAPRGATARVTVRNVAQVARGAAAKVITHSEAARNVSRTRTVAEATSG
jgi:hypothetical protein